MEYNKSVKLFECPKWVARVIKWAVKKRLPKGVKLILYGRGKGSCRGKYNFGSKPLRFCKRAVIYLYFYDKQLHDYHNLYQENWRLKKQLEDRDKLSFIPSERAV